MSVEVNEERWYEYALECEEDGVRASISDYLIWLDEHGD